MPVALLSDTIIILIIVIITLMIYRDMKFLLSPIPSIYIGVVDPLIDPHTYIVSWMLTDPLNSYQALNSCTKLTGLGNFSKPSYVDHLYSLYIKNTKSHQVASLRADSPDMVHTYVVACGLDEEPTMTSAKLYVRTYASIHFTHMVLMLR